MKRYSLALIVHLLLPGCAPSETPSRSLSTLKSHIQAGEQLYASVCATCHGNAAQGEGFFPQLAGRPATELAERLRAYRAGKKIGAHSETMQKIASALQDDQINDVTQWLSTLPKPER